MTGTDVYQLCDCMFVEGYRYAEIILSKYDKIVIIKMIEPFKNFYINYHERMIFWHNIINQVHRPRKSPPITVILLFLRHVCKYICTYNVYELIGPAVFSACCKYFKNEFVNGKLRWLYFDYVRFEI